MARYCKARPPRPSFVPPSKVGDSFKLFSCQAPSTPPFQSIVPFDFGPPTAALVPPQQCVLGPVWEPLPLLCRSNVSPDTVLLTFGLKDKDSALGLSTCACIVASDGKGTARAYTPISTNKMLGQFQLMVKVYDDSMGGGVMSRHLNSLVVGDTVDFKHIPLNVKIQYPFGVERVGMLAGGTGVTPMIQALHAILGTDTDTSTVALLWSNQKEQDIGVSALDDWAAAHADRFTLVHTLTREPEESSWSGRRGRIDRKLIEETMPKPFHDCKILICGTKDFNTQMKNLLKEMQYSDTQIAQI